MCFISMYSVLNTLLQYTYFYISKSITSYTFLLAFKIVVSLHCVSLKELHKTDKRQHWFALHFSPAHTQRTIYTGNKSKLIVKQLCLQLCQQLPSDRNPSSAGQTDCQQYFSCIHHIYVLFICSLNCFYHCFHEYVRWFTVWLTGKKTWLIDETHLYFELRSLLEVCTFAISNTRVLLWWAFLDYLEKLLNWNVNRNQL